MPAERSKPEHVDGDLVELDPETLAMMRGEKEKLDSYDYIPPSLRDTPAEDRLKRQRRENREAQARLRDNISLWAGFWRDGGACDSEIYRRFYSRFEIDIMSAQALKVKKADILNATVDSSLKNLIASNGQ